MIDLIYEIHQRCQICCVFTSLRPANHRYCEKCQTSDDLVPIPMTEWYEKGSMLIVLDESPSWKGRPMQGFG